MSEEPLSPEDERALQELVQNVAEALGNGVPPSEVTKGLVGSGMPEAEAKGLVSNVAQHMAAAGNAGAGGGGGSAIPSWAIWIGIILLINLLSYLFNWPFWIY